MTTTELVEPSQATSLAEIPRVAEIRSRLHARSSSGADGTSFEALLADATARQRRSGGALVAAEARPEGALGGVLGAARSAPPVPVASTPFGMPSSTVGSGRGAGQAVVGAAMNHLGVPYLWGGTDAKLGFDCSGLIQDAFEQIGVEMPKWSRHQANMGVEVESIEDALPGDVLAFGEPVSHVALYVGDGRMLHAPRTGEVVKIEPIDRPIRSIRRIVTPSGSPSSAAPMGGTRFQTPSEAERLYQPLFAESGARWGIDPALLAAVAKTESGFDLEAVSPAGARGLMQFMPSTAAEMGVDPWDPASAIEGAARYLRTSLDQFGSAELAIASYNAGRGAVARYSGVPPYAETTNYVKKVLAAWRSRT